MTTNPHIPQRMLDLKRWLRWRPEVRNGRTTKVPTTTRGRMGSSTNHRTWATFDEALTSEHGAGLGFALGEGIGCIDLDDAVDDKGFIENWAERILDLTPPTFIEVSQSMRGLHIWGLLPEAKGRNLRSNGMSVEFYSTGRFIALGSEVWEGSVPELADLAPLTRELVA